MLGPLANDGAEVVYMAGEKNPHTLTRLGLARSIWAQDPLGPGPVLAQGPFGPRGRLGPGPVWAQDPLGPRAHLGQF